MNKNSIRWIISLMSLSLVGLICFQGYWILLTIHEKETEFDNTIMEVLAEVDNEIQNSEAVKFIKRYDVQPTTSYQYSSSNYGDVEEEKFIYKETISDSASIINKINEKIKNFAVNGNAIVVASSSNQTINFSSSDSITDENQLIVHYTNKKNKLTEIVDKLSLEFAFDQRSLAERVKGVKYRKIVDEALNDHGITDLDYSILISDMRSDSLLYSDSDPNSINESTELYDRLIFERDDEQEGGLLTLAIPHKTSYLINAVWWPLLISLLLTGILLYTFSYTIKAIFKQKKIAKIKADFINNMTHEFKTPVATISLAIDSMLHEEVRNNQSELKKFGKIIKKENKRMNDQIERLLEMALFDREKIELNMQSLDAHSIIQELKTDFDLKSKKEDGQINLLLNAKESSIMADKMHFYNLIRNVIDNAIKYSKDIFKIEIETLNKEYNLVIIVRDNGIGMDEDTIKKIFDRFYRKTSGNIHSTKGFGLGLAYVKEILERMNGSISVKSELNKGSEFTIEIPTL